MGFTIEMAVMLAVGGGAIVLFVTEWLSPDLVALLAVLVILLTGVAAPELALSGFANPAVHTIAALFVISAGLMKTGAVETFGRWLIALAGKNPLRLTLSTLVTVVVLSAFVNNTPIVVMMIPVVLAIAEANRVPPSKLLIPVSYASIMGGSMTLIGTSTNLVVSGMAVDAGRAPLSMFELLPLGAILAVVGIAYLVLFGRRLLPSREPVTANIAGGRVRDYITELVVRRGSPLAGVPFGETALGRQGELRPLQVMRGERILWPPLDRVRLREGDLLLVKGRASAILEAGRRDGVDIIPEEPDSPRDTRADTLAELVVTPGSRFEGATIAEVGFRRHFRVAVLALQRHGLHFQREIRSTRLRTGDILLVTGEPRAIERMKGEEGVILLEGVESRVRYRHRAPAAVAIAAGVVLAATLSGLPVAACALTGALLTVLTGCLSARDLYRSLDVRTLVLIAGMIGVGAAAQETRTAEWVADRILDVVRPLGPYGVLAVLYLLTNVVTEFLSNAAAAVLMVPLALSMAAEMPGSPSPRPFLVAVAVAASAAFSSPVGYQTNTIVYGPGGYRFTDYPKVGLPLNLLFWAISVAVIPVIWPF